ncbi:MAG: Dabb family protein [Clostridia bacterium]|nr:Dabb family protein [Clostridia bacterium]
MVKHIVLWKIKDDENKQKNIDRMIEMLTALVGKIDGLVGIEMGYNFDVSSEYDVVLYATFKNAVALKYYQNHPEHVKCKEFIGKIATGRTSADYFWEEEISAQRPFAETPDAPEPPETTSSKVEPKPVTPPVQKAEPKPFEFEFTPNNTTAKPTEQVNAPTPPFVPKTEPPKTEPKPSIFKKKETVPTPPPPPMATSDDTWTCQNCGKVMPNYVGTCGCGEPKPFEFEFTSNNNAPVATPPVAPVKVQEPKSTVNTASYNSAEKISRKPIFSQTDNNTQSDSWTCPNCHKVLPNYVGTCGCGEPKPFGDFNNTTPPDIQNNDNFENTENTYEINEKFSNVEPSLPSYNPQIQNQNTQDNDFTQQDLSFIKNDSANTNNVNNYNNTSAPDFSFIKPSDNNFSNTEQPIYPNAVQPTNNEQNTPTNTNNEPENNETDDGYFFNFDNMPPPAPMRFSDEPPASLHLNVNDPKPMNYNDIKKQVPGYENNPQPVEIKSVSRFKNSDTPKIEKKHLFGKKAKEADALKKAEEVANSRKDVPNDGTWTCPNCGKVMPTYVGTCGCGEPKPFEF